MSSEYVSEATAFRSINRDLLERTFGDLEPSTTFLDVGCGVGNSIAALVDDLGRANVYGLDFSEQMVAAARGKGLGKGIECVDFESDDVPRSWPRTFDAVFGSAFLHMFPAGRAE